VALVVAVVGQFWKEMDSSHLIIWLGVALGNYGASKITEMVTTAKRVTVEAGPAGGNPNGCVETPNKTVTPCEPDDRKVSDPGTDQEGV